MRRNKVVVKFKNGTVKKGVIENWSAEKTHFYLHSLEGNIENIDVEQLKAVYFVKDFEGNKIREESYKDFMAGEGIKIGVKFKDGEIIIGYCLAYSPKRHGFMITPADYQSNNTRIFVIQSATEKIANMYDDETAHLKE